MKLPPADVPPPSLTRHPPFDWPADVAAAIIDTAGCLIVVLDRDGQIVHANRAVELATGYTLAEIERALISDLFLTTEEMATVLSDSEHLSTGSESHLRSSHWRTRDGRRRHVLWSSTALCRDEAPRQIVVSGIDVTEIRELELRSMTLEHERAQLEGATFTIRCIAHHLNNDLSILVATMDLLRDRHDLPADVEGLIPFYLQALEASRLHLEKLQRVSRIETMSSPVGPMLDLDRSSSPNPR